jgi:hypothetical protein
MTKASPDSATPRKKEYQSPRLISYGDIAQLTTAVGWMGMKDGGMFFMSRTS